MDGEKRKAAAGDDAADKTAPLKKKKHALLAILGVCMLAILLIELLPKRLAVSYYTLSAPLERPLRIVQLSDLHNAEFGEGNSRLIEAVRAQSPDLIVMTGDMLNRGDADLTVVKTLIAGLKEIAPICYGYGNHETAWEKRRGGGLREELRAAGAVVLEKEYVDLELNGSRIRIGGYMAYYRRAHLLAGEEELQERDHAFFEDFEDTARCKILLNHIPTSWVDWQGVDSWPVDLVLCGHYHGGVIRIPFTEQGLYAPYVGWFPRFSKGLMQGTRASCVLSAGLGTEYLVPRLNNPPEIVVVDLIPAD